MRRTRPPGSFRPLFAAVLFTAAPATACLSLVGCGDGEAEAVPMAQEPAPEMTPQEQADFASQEDGTN